jgi:hypothetical protein
MEILVITAPNVRNYLEKRYEFRHGAKTREWLKNVQEIIKNYGLEFSIV